MLRGTAIHPVIQAAGIDATLQNLPRLKSALTPFSDAPVLVQTGSGDVLVVSN